ncbi:Heavy-metal resistance [Cribrihabitans marinus]|uniref:Heavy-metal resistance n=1 Tax=Cribrihabitans marinus TaxID=1227549 RepID=A0A1H6U0D6_9RHOB|nr:periplasmic heavy metal sensor [Cribrihabitans marinus]GGH21378.1 hypothetical protein GCM10010973_05950 [Cribrihabitans marinus]SEI82987.1 Heavy-metal resistance [Cribrihabitans marinus]
MSEEKPKMRPRMRLLLGLSLAMNLVVIGMVAGAVLRHGTGDGARHPPRNSGVALFRALPDADRAALRAHLRRDQAAGRAARREEMQALAEMLRTDPFDAEALADRVRRHARERTARAEAAQALWLDRVRAMSDAERAAYADRLSDLANRRWTRRHD